MAHEAIGQLGSVLLILAKLIYASEVNFRAAALGSRDFFFFPPPKFFENFACAFEPGLHLSLCF